MNGFQLYFLVTGLLTLAGIAFAAWGAKDAEAHSDYIGSGVVWVIPIIPAGLFVLGVVVKLALMAFS